MFAKSLGSLRSQNIKKHKILEIKPDSEKLKKLKKMKKKVNSVLRYHQTNLGGSIHSDGPQLENPPKYIIMACEKNALKGGESVLSNSKKIYEFLKKNKPEYLKLLTENFFFERRGFKYKNKNIFSKPIFYKSNEKFIFRYMREYMESAYRIKNRNLSIKQKKALDFLDFLLSSEKFRTKLKLNRGDMLLVNNHLVAHGRTAFKLNKKKKQRFKSNNL